MTNYGTIPTSSSPGGPSSNIEYLSRTKQIIKQGLGSRRPWKLMFNIRSMNLPSSITDSITRVRTNIAYFRMNYAIIVLVILFLSLLWHPISLIVFAAMMAAWVVLYFLRDEPLVVFRRTIDDRVVLVVLGVLTIVFLFLTDATSNILLSLLVGAVCVLVHASFRKTDDLYDDDDDDDESAGLLSGPSSSS